MPSIDLDGLTFDLALSDGEVLDVTIYDRVEFMDVWGDHFDSEPTRAQIEEWGRYHLSDLAQKQIWWRLESEAECNGVSDSDRLFSTGWAR